METLAGESDQLSDLPVFILHHILSFLDTPAELVRMSVLSKTWFHLTASFPFLYFNVREFTSRECFFKYVEYTTSRFCLEDVTACTLTLKATLREPAEIDIVDRCLELLLQKGVRELEINMSCFTNSPDDDDDDVPRYRLPNVLLSVSALQYLELCNCDLPSSLMSDAVKFNSLIELKLAYVHIDDEVIKYITTSCPLLQVFKVIRCHGFTRFCVYGHHNLQEVWIDYDTPVEIIDVEAPNLSHLFVIDDNLRGAPRMSLASCKKLTTVTYVGLPSPNSDGFNDFLSNFPFVENLTLVTDYKGNNLKLSSPSLKALVLYNFDSDYVLEKTEFNTPNLVSFTYPCDTDALMSILIHRRCPLLRGSTHLKACMQCYPCGYIDLLWFQRLRKFFDKKIGFKVLNLYIRGNYSKKFLEFEKLKAIELPPYELEHVELQLENHDESLAHIAFVDAVLWCCRPRSLTLTSSSSSSPLTNFEQQSDVVKFTYERLLQQEDQHHTNIQIVSRSSSKTVSFKKEEVSQGEVDSQRFAGLKIF